jgi:hypothetical protein
MKTYMTIYMILISGVTFACEHSIKEKAQQAEKEQPYVSITPTDILTKTFKEPLLTNLEFKNKEVYRFTYLPTFESPMTFRLEVLDDSQGIIYYTRISGRAGHDLGVVRLSSSRPIKGLEFTNILEILREPRIHKTYGNLTQKNVYLLGGLYRPEWYLESISNNKYLCSYVWAAGSLPDTKAMLLHQGAWFKELKKISEQLDPQPFISACISLTQAAGYSLDIELESLKPIKKANKAQ